MSDMLHLKNIWQFIVNFFRFNEWQFYITSFRGDGLNQLCIQR